MKEEDIAKLKKIQEIAEYYFSAEGLRKNTRLRQRVVGNVDGFGKGHPGRQVQLSCPDPFCHDRCVVIAFSGHGRYTVGCAGVVHKTCHRNWERSLLSKVLESQTSRGTTFENCPWFTRGSFLVQ